MSQDVFTVPYSEKPAEKQHDIRFIGVVAGCYSLSERLDEGAGCESVFACRTKSISTKRIEIEGPVRGEVGEAISLKLQEFEIIRGRVCAVTDRGMVVEVAADDDERTKIAGTIDWVKKNKFRSVKDQRDHKRIMLAEPRSAIVFGDGRVVECFVIDVSQSGAGVSADICVKEGVPMALGSAVGVVARKLEVGFAVEFIEPLNMDKLDEIFSWSLDYI